VDRILRKLSPLSSSKTGDSFYKYSWPPQSYGQGGRLERVLIESNVKKSKEEFEKARFEEAIASIQRFQHTGFTVLAIIAPTYLTSRGDVL
jgi:hypothetical protein